MKRYQLLILTLVFTAFNACSDHDSSTSILSAYNPFPNEMVQFNPYPSNPVFRGTGGNTWDSIIRERGFILFDEGVYKLWYSGYNYHLDDNIYLGYATSKDGVHWERYSDKPIFDELWTEDMFIEKHEHTYYMFAEGVNEDGHVLISDDGISWESVGPLLIYTAKGDTMRGPYGTPTIWIEDGIWYLFYERDDDAVWLATTKDEKKLTWTNVQDYPVLMRGPERYDRGAVATDHIVKIDSTYYMYYHGTSSLYWLTYDASAVWNSNVAISYDLVNWTKYPGNPLIEGDYSSPVVLLDGDKTRLYTMHPEVHLFYSK